ncbi:MAG: hypothetical protein ACPGIC_04245, partial [Opitutales bacterium]
LVNQLRIVALKGSVHHPSGKVAFIAAQRTPVNVSGGQIGKPIEDCRPKGLGSPPEQKRESVHSLRREERLSTAGL